MADRTVTSSFLAAALAVLETAEQPLTAAEITHVALDRGLIRSAGKTPVASLTAALYTYVRDYPEGRLVRLSQPGPRRAIRGSVRWTVRRTA